jgi:hypothetical protein
MFPRSSTPVFGRQDGGFALIIVLWTLVLIAFIVAHLTATGRGETRIATNIVGNAVAQAAADRAIFDTIFNLSDPHSLQRWPVDGTVRDFVVGDSRVRVRLENETWWINPNLASPALLEALLRVTGSDAELADRLHWAWLVIGRVSSGSHARDAQFSMAPTVPMDCDARPRWSCRRRRARPPRSEYG